MKLIPPLVVALVACTPEPACGPGTHADGGLCLPDAADTADSGDTGTDTGDTTDTGAETGDTHDTGDSGDTDTGDTDTGTTPDWTVCASGGAPYADIQPAVDAATEGQTIYVCPGTYSFVDIERHGVNLVGAGPEDTIVDGGASHTAITVSGVPLSISGFTLTGTGQDSRPAALAIEASSGTILDVWFTGAGAPSYYVAIQHDSEFLWEEVLFEDNDCGGLVTMDGGSAEVLHSVFRGNGGWPLNSDEATDMEFHNNLMVGNEGGADVRGGWFYNNVVYNNVTGNYQVVSLTDGVVFENNIVAENTGLGVYVLPDYTLNYNDVWGQTGWNYQYSGGTTIGTNFEADPKFTDPEHGDFTLDPGFSPGVNAGNALSGYNDVDGTRNDLGIFGGPDGDWVPL